VILRHLRYFAAAADAGSLAGAARRLRVAQPALSRQIHQLERSIGTPLFTRDRRGVRLTRAGSQLLVGARATMDKLAVAVRRTRLTHRGELGCVRLGIGRWALHTPTVGRALSRVRDRYPGVDLVIVEAATLAQTRLLREKALDVGIGIQGFADSAGIAATALYEDPIDSAVLPASHPLASRASVEIADLRALPLISLDPEVAKSIVELFRALHRAGIERWEQHETIESVYSQVAAGRGWSHAPRAFRQQPPEGTVVIPLRGFSVPFDVSARWREDDNSALTANIVHALREAFGWPDDEDADAVHPWQDSDADEPLPPALELRHVKALLAAADKPLREAAVELGITQSGVSRQIATLERAVGARLTEHRGNRLVLTRAGATWRAETAEAMRVLDDAVRAAHRAEDRRTGCTIGAVPPEVAGDVLIDVLRALGARRPPVVAEIRELLTSTQIAALRAQEIDVGVAGAFPSIDEAPEIASARLSEDVIDCVLVARSHPLAKRDQLEPADLQDVPFIFVSRDAYPRMHEVVMPALARIGLTPRVLSAVDGPRVIWRMVADTEGWSLGIRAMRARPPAGLVAVPVRGLRIPAPVYLLWRRDERDAGVLAVVEAFRAREMTTGIQPATMS
jgi:DNA-binding transcriptional LysR family regulator